MHFSQFHSSPRRSPTSPTQHPSKCLLLIVVVTGMHKTTKPAISPPAFEPAGVPPNIVHFSDRWDAQQSSQQSVSYLETCLAKGQASKPPIKPATSQLPDHLSSPPDQSSKPNGHSLFPLSLALFILAQ
eukprot:1161636-Pelagomonas_calceolata.AAC.8